MPLILMTLVAALGAAANEQPASCRRFDEPPSPQSRADEATVIARGPGRTTIASVIDAVLRDGEWRLVWATPRDSEPGVFFLKRSGTTFRLIDTWDGSTSDRRGAARWASGKIGVPAPLARCFARTIGEQGAVKLFA